MKATHLLAGVGLGAVAIAATALLAGSTSSVAVEVAQQTSAVGPGFTDSWAKTCTTTASTIVPSGVSVVAFECQAPESGETGATQLVAIGDSGIGDPAFATRTSPVICGSGCNQTAKHVNNRQAYCRSDSSDVQLFCWAVAVASVQP